MILTDKQKNDLEKAIEGIQYGVILIRAREGKGVIEVHESVRIGEKETTKIDPLVKI